MKRLSPQTGVGKIVQLAKNAGAAADLVEDLLFLGQVEKPVDHRQHPPLILG